MLRKLLPLMALAVVLVLPATVSASTPAIYHTIKGSFAGAHFSSLDGCYQTEVWVSTSAAMYAPQPGIADRLNRQALTTVAITIYDTCQPMEGKHYPIVADWFAQTSDQPAFEPRLQSARLSADVAMEDAVSGAVQDVPVDLTWWATGVEHPDTVRNNHVRFVGEGVVNTHDNNLIVSAVASGSVMLAGTNVAVGADEEATLQQVRSACMEIRYPHWPGDTYFCFGF